MVEPCIKGVVIRISADRVRAMLETGKLREDDLERWLTARDVELISEPPRPTLWYPIETMTHLLELMRDVEGAGDERYLALEAAREIDNVLRAPAMAAVVHGARAFGKRAGVALVKLTNLTFNFGCWTYTGEDLENFAVEAAEINVGDLEELFDAGAEVTPEALEKIGYLKKRFDVLKVLGDGEVTKKLTISAHRFSAQAKAKIEKAGGSVKVLKPAKVENEHEAKAKAAKTARLEGLRAAAPEAKEAKAPKQDEKPAAKAKKEEKPAKAK